MFFTLDRYILREFFRIFLLSLLAMMAFYEMVTFIDMAGYFFKFKAPPTVIGRYMLYKIPMALFHVTPICVLLASVLTMAQFSRTSELVAMKVAGMGLWRVAAPVIAASGAVSAVRARYTADGAELVNNQWVFTNLTQRKFAASGRFTEQRWDKAPLDGRLVALEDLGRARLDPEEMNLEQIREYIRDIRAKGYNTAVYVADMHAKIAFPLITLVMPLLAIPLGARSSRSGGMLAGIVVAVVIGVTFWFMFSMSVAFGRAGRLPPEVAAYGAHVVFGLTGLWMLVTDRR
ncbi:MAG: LptF/LptG family permease [Nitrospinae bacterium]|nr:LptF/LptG family permease [Nitrospinota bacterium]